MAEGNYSISPSAAFLWFSRVYVGAGSVEIGRRLQTNRTEYHVVDEYVHGKLYFRISQWLAGLLDVAGQPHFYFPNTVSYWIDFLR